MVSCIKSLTTDYKIGLTKTEPPCPGLARSSVSRLTLGLDLEEVMAWELYILNNQAIFDCFN